jgi:NAD(P)-dependent dehydrogenase (short-subunit alcohol dehydrogenase family)
MAEVRAVAARLCDTVPRIDVLINNAGALFPEREVTAEGLEATFATNLLSPFLLTNLLVPRLIESAPARIITVSSGGMYTQPLVLDDLQSEDGYRGAVAYARAKRAQIDLTLEWAERLDRTGVTVHAMHPGWADTPGVRSSLPGFRLIMGPLLRSPEEGADTIVWLAAAPDGAGTSGRFWHDRRIRPVSRRPNTATSPEDRRVLWTELARMAGIDPESV